MIIKHIIAGIAGLVSILGSFLLFKFTGWLFLALLFIWFVIILLGYLYIYQKSSSKRSDFVLLFFTLLSLVCLSLLVEWNILKNFLIIFSGLCTAFLFMRTPQEDKNSLSFARKPYRRALNIIWAFDVFSTLSAVFAAEIFFPNFPFIIALLIGAGIIFLANIMIWKNYLPLGNKELMIWSGILSLIIFELAWVFHLLPLGHFSLGFLTAWIWYIILNLFRFNFSDQGIVWGRQKGFLIANFGLMLLYLIFLVKWI